ncbi:WAP four-disulfide core domain protein 8-like isoform X2 [Pleurodeles waltl]|uniref:WAP four-disulfide core domain protein 8-like isoform X2 n=1 Tax=Pleurodeles waltl TaxID=8319 RepID=UPI00370964C3
MDQSVHLCSPGTMVTIRARVQEVFLARARFHHFGTGSAKTGVHDSFCPYPGMARTECSLKNQQVTCYDDSNCAGDEKCCYEMCNRKCMKSVPAQSDLCPLLTSAELNKCDEVVIGCQSDFECLTDERCCFSMCEDKCVKVHDSFCPYPGMARTECSLKNQQVTCYDDSNCAGDEKCCYEMCNRKCMKSVPDTVHAGFCPPPIAVNTCFVLFQQDMCASDSTCATDEKCCSTWCNRMCRKSVAERTD